MDQALRARVTEFFDLHVKGEFRRAEALVRKIRGAGERRHSYRRERPRLFRLSGLMGSPFIDELSDYAFHLDDDGMLAIPNSPGLGITLDDDAVTEYSSRGQALGVCRSENLARRE